MRELKFRMWDGNKLDYDPVIYGSHELGECWMNGSIRDEQKDGKIFEQFTGLRDKNGKEIYEGDIVDYPIEVTFDVQHFAPKLRINVVVWDGDRFRLSRFSWEGYMWGHMEIIGNIHENLELLEDRDDSV